QMYPGRSTMRYNKNGTCLNRHSNVVWQDYLFLRQGSELQPESCVPRKGTIFLWMNKITTISKKTYLLYITKPIKRQQTYRIDPFLRHLRAPDFLQQRSKLCRPAGALA